MTQIWRSNVPRQINTREPVPKSWQRLGVRILLDEVPPAYFYKRIIFPYPLKG